MAFFCFFALLRISEKKITTIVSAIFLAFLTFISLYHSGIEAGLIKNIFSCSTSKGLDAKNIDDLSQIIMSTENNDCAFPKFSIFGLTLSNLGFISSFLLFFINLLILKKMLFNKYDN